VIVHFTYDHNVVDMKDQNIFISN